MYEIIFNPGSRGNKGILTWNTVERILNEKEIEYLLYTTTHAGHAEELAREITSDGKEHTFIVIGGDGTLNEVLNGLAYPNLATIGLIPAGSGNDFAKTRLFLFHLQSHGIRNLFVWVSEWGTLSIICYELLNNIKTKG